MDFDPDPDLIDGQRAVEQFMRMSVTDPNVAELLFRDQLIKMARHQRRLECVQGKCIVNSGSLKVGEEGALTARQALYDM